MIKRLKQHLLYENKWIRFWKDDVEFPSGDQGEYTYMERPTGGPLIVAQKDDGKLIVLHEWRYPIQDWTYCLPMGYLDHDEDPVVAAKRELEEETGYVAATWTQIGTLRIDPGGNSQVSPVFYATGLTQGTAATDHGEVHEVCEFSIAELESMIEEGKIGNGWLLAGLSLLRAHHNKT